MLILHKWLWAFSAGILSPHVRGISLFLIQTRKEEGGGLCVTALSSVKSRCEVRAQQLVTLVTLFCLWPLHVWAATVFFLLVSRMPMYFNDRMTAFWGQALIFWLSWYLPSAASVSILVFGYFLCKSKLAVTHQLFWLEETSEGLLLFTCLPFPLQASWMDASPPLPWSSLIYSSKCKSSHTNLPPHPYLTYLVLQDRNVGDTMDYFLFFVSASIPMFNQS